MYCTNKIEFLVIFVLLILNGLVKADTSVAENILDELYLKYKEAVKADTKISLRRFLKDNKYYEVHVKKLKEVNGFKKHNLMVKESLRKGSPFIYINNPVESKIPNAFLSEEEFKNVLISRGLSQRTTVSNTNTKLTKSYVLPKSTVTIAEPLIDNTNHYRNDDQKSDNKSTEHAVSTKTALTAELKMDSIELTEKEGDILTNTTVTENVNLAQSSVKSSVTAASIKQSSITTLAPTKVNLRSKLLPNFVIENEKIVIEDNTSKKLLGISQRPQNISKVTNLISLDKTLEENYTLSVSLDTEKSHKTFSSHYTILTETSSIQTNHVSKREGPRRKTTSKFTSESIMASLKTKTKRTTLGRPLVFMGS